MPDFFTLPVRYAREVTDVGVRCREENFQLAHRSFVLPSRQCALVMVDCWSEHVVESHLERGGYIAEKYILPVLEAFRAARLAVVHAPAPGPAARYPDFLRYDDEMPPRFGFESTSTASSTWPPRAFRQRAGEHAEFARAHEPLLDRWRADGGEDRRGIIPLLAPKGDDVVVANGEQLQRLCEAQQILHLFYVGFATNICVEHRDYVRATAAPPAAHCYPN